MKPILTLLFLVVVIAPLAHGQIAPNEPAVLNNTTLGRSQNDDRDFANSLSGTPQRYGKGDKKSQVSATELKSKSIKDSTFGGSLLNMGIDSSVPKLDETKLHHAPTETEKQSTAVKQQAASAEAKESAEDRGQRSEDRSAASEKNPAASTEPAESQDTFSNLSATASLADNLVQADANAALAGNDSKTSYKATTATTSGDNSKKDSGADKSSSTKPDGDK